MTSFSWGLAGSGIEYELRAGPTWDTGRFVGRAAGNHLVALWPIRDAIDENFWIKSVSSAGLYSDTAAVSTTRLAPLAFQFSMTESVTGDLFMMASTSLMSKSDAFLRTALSFS